MDIEDIAGFAWTAVIKGEVEKEVGATTGTRRRMARQSPGVNVRSIG